MAKTLTHLSHQRRKNRIFLLAGILVLMFSSCTVRPRSVLSQKKMADVLYDLHSAEGVLQAAGYNNGKDEELGAYYEAILMKHGITQAGFDSSIVWYTDNPKQFCIVYNKVVQRLKADRDREKEISAQISRKFFEERGTEVCVDTNAVDLFRCHPVLSYIVLPSPYEGYTIQEESFGSDFRYVAFPSKQDSIVVPMDSVTSETARKNALSKSPSAVVSQDTSLRNDALKARDRRHPRQGKRLR